MENNEKNIYLVCNEKAESVKQQMLNQGYILKPTKNWQEIFEAINLLYIDNIITDAQHTKIMTKFLKEIYINLEKK